MLYLPYSEQIFLVSIFRPPFAEAYADTVSRPSSDIMEQILMILPCPFLIMDGITALDTIKGPFKSISITWRNWAAVISVMGILLMIPALFTRISIIPTSPSI